MKPMTDSDRARVGEVAKGLSEQQRDALLRCLNGYYDPNVVRALRRKGLIAGYRFTPFGLAVRAHLTPDAPDA